MAQPPKIPHLWSCSQNMRGALESSSKFQWQLRSVDLYLILWSYAFSFFLYISFSQVINHLLEMKQRGKWKPETRSLEKIWGLGLAELKRAFYCTLFISLPKEKAYFRQYSDGCCSTWDSFCLGAVSSRTAKKKNRECNMSSIILISAMLAKFSISQHKSCEFQTLSSVDATGMACKMAVETGSEMVVCRPVDLYRILPPFCSQLLSR